MHIYIYMRGPRQPRLPARQPHAALARGVVQGSTAKIYTYTANCQSKNL